MNYNVMCRVSGGVTGTRSALLKGVDGQVKVFATADEAQAEAGLLNRAANVPNAKAFFEYWVVSA